MSRDIPESDWRAFRKVRELALERFCQRILGEIGSIAAKSDITYHARYLEIFRLIDQRDDELARAFNVPRRSSAVLQLVAMYSHGLLTQDELLCLTPATRETVESLSKPHPSTRGRKRA